MDDFYNFFDEEKKRTLLASIIYRKIQNLGEIEKVELGRYFIKTPEESDRLINEFHQEVTRITSMLIDKDVFSIEEIVEIVFNPIELLDRCLEAVELLQNESNKQ